MLHRPDTKDSKTPPKQRQEYGSGHAPAMAIQGQRRLSGSYPPPQRHSPWKRRSQSSGSHASAKHSSLCPSCCSSVATHVPAPLSPSDASEATPRPWLLSRRICPITVLIVFAASWTLHSSRNDCRHYWGFLWLSPRCPGLGGFSSSGHAWAIWLWCSLLIPLHSALPSIAGAPPVHTVFLLPDPWMHLKIPSTNFPP